MKIISKFKDYYDEVADIALDLSCIYRRKETDILVNDSEVVFREILNLHKRRISKLFCNNEGKRGRSFLYFREIILGYCGKLIPVFQFIEIEDFWHIEYYNFYKVGEAERHFQSMAKKYPYYSGKENSRKGKVRTLGLEKESIYEERYNIQANSVFHHLQVPLFTVPSMPYAFLDRADFFERGFSTRGERLSFSLNPYLERLEFYQIKDAQTCFQDIYQYINAGLGSTEKTETKMSELDKVQQHGFDKKYGFRKRPGGKKRRKKKR